MGMEYDVAFMAQVRAHLSPIAFRELLEAAAGWKVARIALSPQAAIAVVPVLRRHGLGVAVGEHCYVHAPDQGKAGWSNRLARVAGDDEDVGDVYVYVAHNERVMIEAADAESHGDNEGFGEALAIPPCCREAYGRYLTVIRERQNDPLWSTVLGTQQVWAHHSWNNVAAQYFGRSLLSFAPCSLDCVAAEGMARRAFELLEKIDPDLAASFLDAQRSHVVFSDLCGVHRLERAYREGDVLRFAGVCSTGTSDLGQMLAAADGLRPQSTQRFDLLRGDQVLARIEPDAACGLFLCGRDA